MKISIITVTLNSAEYLPSCINSVRRQTYGNIEHIIVDGKSTDNTLQIIQNNINHIANWISETDRGMYDAINKGIQMATGEIIGVLNSDDMFASDYVIANIAECFKNTKTDSVYGNLVYVDPVDTDRITRFWKGDTYKRSRFNFGWMPAHPTFYMRRDLIQKYGNYENHYYTAADYEFMARYLYKYKISATYMNMMVVKMRTGGASNSNLMRRLRANRRDFLAMKRNKIPFSFLVSILKPISKIHQYQNNYIQRQSNKYIPDFQTSISYLPIESKSVNSHIEYI